MLEKFELHSTNSSETFVIEVNLLEKKNSIQQFLKTGRGGLVVRAIAWRSSKAAILL